MTELFLGVMDLNEAKYHQIKLKNLGVDIEFKTNGETCTSGCRVTVEMWAKENDQESITSYFKSEQGKHTQGLNLDLNALNSVFDTSMSAVTCQACGMEFSPTEKECPDCGLVYF